MVRDGNGYYTCSEGKRGGKRLDGGEASLSSLSFVTMKLRDRAKCRGRDARSGGDHDASWAAGWAAAGSVVHCNSKGSCLAPAVALRYMVSTTR